MTWGGWDAAGSGPDGEKSKIYLAVWLKIAGATFENQAAGTKAGFLAVGRDEKGDNEVFFWLDNGTGRQFAQSRFRVQVKLQGLPQPDGRVVRNLNPNVDRRLLMSAGEWHRWEAVFELNHPGIPDGRVRMWIDGHLTHDYSNVQYLSGAVQRGFYQYKWNPTWGGMGGERTHEDQVMIDHLYLSGIPYERQRR